MRVAFQFRAPYTVSFENAVLIFRARLNQKEKRMDFFRVFGSSIVFRVALCFFIPQVTQLKIT